MKNTAQQPPRPHFLSGWKEIATYLGKGVRTVQRYERSMGLPVHRPSGKGSGSVVASPAELDSWISARPTEPAGQIWGFEVRLDQERAAIGRNIRLMRELREQMMALRFDLRESVIDVRQSLDTLHSVLNRNYAWGRNLSTIGNDTEDLLRPMSGVAPFRPSRRPS